MIVTILELRAQILRFLQKFQLVVEPVIKFIVAFAVFRCINNSIGHQELLMSLPAELLLSLLGTFTPSVLLVLLAAAAANLQQMTVWRISPSFWTGIPMPFIPSCM